MGGQGGIRHESDPAANEENLRDALGGTFGVTGIPTIADRAWQANGHQKWVLELDIQGCFDNISHQAIMWEVKLPNSACRKNKWSGQTT
ncbi:MAG: hypothetical protein GDA44_05460 [Prochloron sp. SP5CPC1]|nr:hypothetical protein [Candidatus Paraprochloron terpiosi SP5CPC1]